MIRREFLNVMGCGLIGISFLGWHAGALTGTGAPTIGSLGKRARKIISVEFPWVKAIRADEIVDHAPDGIVLIGCLGGQTGLRESLDYAKYASSTGKPASAVLLWPMCFEGRRRHDAATAVLRVLRTANVATQIVDVPVSSDMSLIDAKCRREHALVSRARDIVSSWAV